MNRSAFALIPGAFDSRLPAQFSLLNPPRAVQVATSATGPPARG